jgi:hypothetical protein
VLGSKEEEDDEEKLRRVEEYLGVEENLPKEEEVDGAVVRSRVTVGCEFEVENEEF